MAEADVVAVGNGSVELGGERVVETPVVGADEPSVGIELLEHAAAVINNATANKSGLVLVMVPSLSRDGKHGTESAVT